MFKTQRITSALAVGVMIVAAAAQIAPICCRYVYEWPDDGSNPGPDGPCSGYETKACESTVASASSTDPLSEQYGPLRDAFCYHFFLPTGTFFVRQDCALPPPPSPATLVGVLPNGTCCYAVGVIGSHNLVIEARSFKVPECRGVCLASPN